MLIKAFLGMFRAPNSLWFLCSDTAGFPRSRRLSRPWPRLRRLGTGLSAFGIGRPAFPAVDCYDLARLTRRRTAAGGDASAAWLRLLSPSLLVGSGFEFCGTTVMVVLPRCHESESDSESARAGLTVVAGSPIPADNFPNELARV